MPFELFDALGTLIRVMNQLFRPYIGKFLVVYIKDIIVYNKTKEEHFKHFRTVLQTLRKERFCVFKEIYFPEFMYCFPWLCCFIQRCSKRSWGRLGLFLIAYAEEHSWSVELLWLDDILPTIYPQLQLYYGAYHRVPKKGAFQWTKATMKAFEDIELKMTGAPVIVLPNFSKVFEVACYASHIGIEVVLSQEGHSISLFCEKSNSLRRNMSIYDLKFYVVVQVLRYWWHYLLGKEFTIYSNYEALKHFNSHKKLDRW